MFTVALIGPDGAGKTTIGREIEQVLSIPIKYVYMGINLEASNLVLPTTRLVLEVKRALGKRPDMSGPPDPTRTKSRPKGGIKGLFASFKSGLRLANRLSEEWFRQFVVWFYQSRGYVVLFDRHFFFDYYFHHVVENGLERSLSDRMHGFFLERLYPRPDLVICLDAPAEVLFSRKGEGTVALLESRRQEYLGLQNVVKNFVKVDVTKPKDEVLREVSDVIMRFSKQQDAGDRKEENNEIYA
jgi:thymidylate kinase